MTRHDAVIIGGGVIGLSVAWELARRGLRPLVVERGECGRESTYAAAGMLAYGDPEPHRELLQLKLASARLYPEFVHELEDESGLRVDFRREGTISFLPEGEEYACPYREVRSAELERLEPALSWVGLSGGEAGRVVLTSEETIDNRALAAALVKTLKHRGVDMASGSEVTGVIEENGRAAGVRTARTEYRGGWVINCAGAWAGQIGAPELPIGPRKGQSLALISSGGQLLRHAIRGHHVYIVPRSDGRIIIGATVEDAGYDKRVGSDTIQRLHQAAAGIVPPLGELRMHEAWAGLRPFAHDALPVIGPTGLPGCLVASAHFRNGILLAPVTARIIADLAENKQPAHDFQAFLSARFRKTN
ncbi:MAG: glycine oxidase ThiO [Acidobacteria bacterium]|nr:glycine oxidase ThiO [Acidobacteriota bacterium]